MTKMSNELENHCVKKSSVESGQVHRPRILPPWDAEAGRSQTQTEHTQLGKTFHQGKDKRGLGIVDVCLSGMQEAWGVCVGVLNVLWEILKSQYSMQSPYIYLNTSRLQGTWE